MNTIELMLKPIRTALEAAEALGMVDEYIVGLRAAIAAGEAELRREQDKDCRLCRNHHYVHGGLTCIGSSSACQGNYFEPGEPVQLWVDQVPQGETK